jgi:hypothetical protein
LEGVNNVYKNNELALAINTDNYIICGRHILYFGTEKKHDYTIRYRSYKDILLKKKECKTELDIKKYLSI